MKPLLLLIFTSLFFINTSQGQNYKWAQKLGNLKSDKATAIKTDDSGYVYIAGYFSNQIILGTNNLILPFAHNATSKEAYIAKFDSLGKCLWARSGGQNFDDRVLGMDVDAAGNSVITGTYWEGAGIHFAGNFITAAGLGFGDQCFVVKHDPYGNFLWGNFVCSNSGDDQGTDVATDVQGNSYICGFMSGITLYCGGNTITAANTNTTTHKHAYWLAKINKNGVFQWAKTFGNLPWDATHNKYIERDIAVCVDKIGGVYVTGGHEGTGNFNGTVIPTLGGYDIFTIKYDTSGNFKWVTGGGSDQDDWSNGICSDHNGHVYITGEHRDSLIMDTIIIKNFDKRDVFVAKLDATTGKPIWGKRAGSDGGSERGNDIVADAKCNVYVCGDINDSAKFGNNITLITGKEVQAFVARISPSGSWNWVANGGGIDSNDRGNSVCMGRNGQVYTCGHFRTPASFGTIGPLVSTGSSDGFMAQLHDASYDQSNDFPLANNTDSICEGETVAINIPNFATIKYSPSNSISTNVDTSKLLLTPTTTTTYTITLMGKGVCATTDTLITTIVVVAKPMAAAVVTPSIVPLIDSATLNIYNATNGTNTYQWFYNNIKFDSIPNTAHTFYTGGTYCFTLVATNTYGCVDTASTCGSVTTREHLYMPNAFSPNADHLNDEYGPYFYSTDLSKISNYTFVIYDRLGNQMFSTTDILKKWNGTLNDRQDCESGVYFYMCRFVNGMNEAKFYKGDVTLVR
jgi:gliding motility-associated-like protein